MSAGRRPRREIASDTDSDDGALASMQRVVKVAQPVGGGGGAVESAVEARKRPRLELTRAPRTSLGAPAAAAAGSGGAGGGGDRKWACGVCTLWNGALAGACAACGSARGGGGGGSSTGGSSGGGGGSSSRSSRITHHASESLEWAVKHAPRVASDLAVSKQRVTAVRNWLAGARTVSPTSPLLLVLHGGPGGGKSSLVSLLAAEAGFDVRVWADEGARGGSGRAWRKGAGEGEDLTALLDRWTGVHGDGDGGGGGTAYVSVAEDFANALGGATLFPALQLAPAHDAGRRGSAPPPPRAAAAAAASAAGAAAAAPCLLLLDSVPAPARPDARALVHTALASFVRRARHAAVLVMSDGGEAGGEAPSVIAVRRAIGDAAAASPRVTIMEVLPVTDAAMLRALRRVLVAEGAAVDDRVLSGIVASACGDVRHALHALQFECVHRRGGPGGALDAAAAPAAPACGRDRFTDPLHGIGKLLHSKRRPLDGALEFDPDDVVQSCAFPPAMVGAFLFENMPPMLCDVEPWADVAEDLSDIDLLTSHRSAMSQKRALTRPVGLSVSASVVGRTLAARRGTLWPLPPGANAFRPIVRPLLLNAASDACAHGRAMRAAFGCGSGSADGPAAADELHDPGAATTAAPPGSRPPKSIALDIAPFTAMMLRGHPRAGPPRCSAAVAAVSDAASSFVAGALGRRWARSAGGGGGGPAQDQQLPARVVAPPLPAELPDDKIVD